jgi:hypothetical protein
MARPAATAMPSVRTTSRGWGRASGRESVVRRSRRADPHVHRTVDADFYPACGQPSTPPENSEKGPVRVVCVTQGGDLGASDPYTAPGHRLTHIWGWLCGQLAHRVDRLTGVGSCTPPTGSIHRSHRVVLHSSPRRWTWADELHPHNPQDLLLSLFCSLLHINRKETGGVDGWGQPLLGSVAGPLPGMTGPLGTLYGWPLQL